MPLAPPGYARAGERPRLLWPHPIAALLSAALPPSPTSTKTVSGREGEAGRSRSLPGSGREAESFLLLPRALKLTRVPAGVRLLAQVEAGPVLLPSAPVRSPVPELPQRPKPLAPPLPRAADCAPVKTAGFRASPLSRNAQASALPARVAWRLPRLGRDTQERRAMVRYARECVSSRRSVTGYDPAVWQSGRPPSRGAATMTAV